MKKSHAYMIAWNKRQPSLPLALKIHEELGLKLGPLAGASDADISALAEFADRGLAR